MFLFVDGCGVGVRVVVGVGVNVGFLFYLKEVIGGFCIVGGGDVILWVDLDVVGVGGLRKDVREFEIWIGCGGVVLDFCFCLLKIVFRLIGLVEEF